MFNKLRGIFLKNTVPKKAPGEIIIGKNSVKEAIAAGRNIDSILISSSMRKSSVAGILQKAKELKIPVKEVDTKKLDSLCDSANHQGIIATVAAHRYFSVDDILDVAAQRGEPPFVIVADEIADPHNLGAIIRTAECAGAHGVIIPARRAASLSFAVAKASAGALEHVKVARVTNIPSVLELLKDRGLWIYGADMDGQPYCKADLTGSVALVIGSEGFGLGRLVKEKCDFILSLPQLGKINSLNASVAAGVLMYEVARQRLGLTLK